MVNAFRKSKICKVLSCYLAIMICLQGVQPMAMYALTEGPSQPEFNSFTPIGTSDMVDLATGDFNYNIPIMDVGGYPINLAYNSGVTMDQEASWVGTGWNLNVGQINRNVRGLPDDFNGDELNTYDNMKENITVGIRPYINFQVIGVGDNVPAGAGLGFGGGLDIQYNNYSGVSAVPSFGASFQLSDNVSVGMQLSSSAESGVSVTPSASISTSKATNDTRTNKMSASISPSVTYNSRQGLQSFNLSSGVALSGKSAPDEAKKSGSTGQSGSGSISFINNTFTPNKRLAFKNNSIQFSFSGGGDAWGFHIEGSVAGYASVQSLLHKHRIQRSYGYEFTDFAGSSDLLDFNREKEQSVVSRNTLVLPVTNYTYDLYTIQGQGLGGMFRPFRGQVGYVRDPLVSDISASNSLGFEIEGGAGAHYGLNFKTTNTTTSTGIWNTAAVPFFKEKQSGNQHNYEKVFFKSIGEQRIDYEFDNLLNSRLGGTSPITLKINGNVEAVNNYQKKITVGSGADLVNADTASPEFYGPIKRNFREIRNQVTQKITNKEAGDYSLDPSIIKKNSYAKSHHTAGYIITDGKSNRHVYGESAYNIEKQEVSFAVGENTPNYAEGLVNYSPGSENSSGNSKGRDNYFNKVVTPAYAHTYLLSSVLSSDYEDLTGNGPTDDDLGGYTKFVYKNMGDYKWRVPFKENMASYNEGLKTDKGVKGDQKGSYLYGAKESKYLEIIETKTHVAFIDLTERRDGYGVVGENGGGGVNGFASNDSKMYKITSIRLYSKPEVTVGNQVVDPGINGTIKPIKTAHFEYDYSLCANIENNSGVPQDENGTNINLGKGKLTLKKVYFTYKNSNMGRFTPYKFNYSDTNPEYHIKAYDIWGNYKEFHDNSWNIEDANTTPQEFPYVQQTSEELQDNYASAWSLASIELPSGGKIDLEYESDDYKYVQNKKAMQMFKIAGVVHSSSGTNEPSISAITQSLYSNSGDAKYIAVKLEGETETDALKIISKYTKGLQGKSIHFNFLLNMKNSDYEFVPGYFVMDGEARYESDGSGKYLFIPMKKLDREGKNSTPLTNPISVAGWFFARQNLNRQVYVPYDTDEVNVVTLGKSLLANLAEMSNIFKGPNQVLRDKNCANHFKPNKSWIRLLEPSGSKMGGGARVKSIVLHDQWQNMLEVTSDLDRYEKQYGQQYEYTLLDGTSSGVATYEPNVCKENPLVEPFYHTPEKLSAQLYEEKPFGESFYPSPTVTYSRVTVTNKNSSGSTKSGKVVTEHYTSYDFPTKTDYTPLNKSKVHNSNEEDVIPQMIKSMLGLKLNLNTDLTMTQGFTVETNDMNGKLKKQEVFDNSGELISGVEYIYKTNGTVGSGNLGDLINKVNVIDDKGKITKETIGVHYDVINDFRESYARTNSFGVNANGDVIPMGVPVFVAVVLPEAMNHVQILRTAVTTKVIHKVGILEETRAYDVGSHVSTKNLAWDGGTGQVLITETVNEFDDKYYNLNYPAYWYYPDMGMATANTDLTGLLHHQQAAGHQSFTGFKLVGTPAITDLTTIFNLGDELMVEITPQEPGEITIDGSPPSHVTRAWVVDFKDDGSMMYLMDRSGNFLSPCEGSEDIPFKIIRSGKRNQQNAFMASVTSMLYPIISVDPPTNETIQNLAAYNYSSSDATKKVVNASAVKYKDFWRGQQGINPPYPDYDSQTATIRPHGGVKYPDRYNVNPYVHNIKGKWRAEMSFAYLTGRNFNAVGGGTNPRDIGFFTSFNPFYKISDGQWEQDVSNWTYASSVTQYSPYGMELENKDALDRYSSAQYGYKNTLPMAVASNSRYQEIGYDGFEEEFGHSPFRFIASTPSTGDDYEITAAESHTGKKSIMVKKGKQVEVRRILNEPAYTVAEPYDCSEPAPTSTPQCPFGDTSILAPSGSEYMYEINMALNFGSDGKHPTNAVTFCNYQGAYSFDFGAERIRYLSNTKPHSTYIILRDSNGDCKKLDLVIIEGQNSAPPIYSIRGCQTACGCP